MKERKLNLATDYYQLSVGNVYFQCGMQDNIGVFDIFIRKNPFKGGYTVFAGTEQIVEYISSLHFDDEDIEMLRRKHPELCEEYLEYLRNFKFTGDIYAVKEGTIVFPQEPIVRVKAPMPQAHIVETALLAIVNHEALIATKASRVCSAASGDSVLDFGMRRAHGNEAGLFAARAAIIGGCSGTSNVEAEYRFDVVSKGTMSHAYVMSFESEYEAFEKFAEFNPGNVVVLLDTYDTLNSGLPNAIKLFKKLRDEGKLNGLYGIRMDSGDMAYFSKKIRKAFDDEGFTDAVISASSDLDEYLISDLKAQGAKINMWGVGTKMITAFDCPALGGVYKLSELTDKEGIKHPKIKISDDPAKITNPGCKKIIRIISNKTNKAMADVIALDDEVIDENKPLEIFHPLFSYKKQVLEDFHCEELYECIYKNGELCYELKPIQEIAAYHKSQKKIFWKGYLRFTNPEEYKVDLSDKLYDLKKKLIAEHTFK